MNKVLEITDDLISSAAAATELGIEEKRLLGMGMRNGIGDPIGGIIGGQVYFYKWSLETLRKRLAAARATAAT